jgi:hypothetical protein
MWKGPDPDKVKFQLFIGAGLGRALHSVIRPVESIT